jgi:hypothetical protein
VGSFRATAAALTVFERGSILAASYRGALGFALEIANPLADPARNSGDLLGSEEEDEGTPDQEDLAGTEA